MAVIKPFGALRFTKKAGEAESLCCPPYDIISEAQRREYLDKNGYNIIRLELPREGENPYSQAGETLEQWLSDGILACDEKPGLYIYEEEFVAYGKRRRVKGYTCRVKLAEFSENIVLPHEETLSKAKQDRFNLMNATACNFSAIYSLYFDAEQKVYPIIEQLSADAPDQSFTDADGVTHRLWIATDEIKIAEVCAAMADKKIYIADGHHRYETALNYRRHLRENGEEIGDGHPANYIMMTLVHMEHEGLVVFPTHRIVRGLADFDAQAMLRACGEYCDVAACGRDEIEAKLDAAYLKGQKAVVLYAGQQAHMLTLKSPDVMRTLLPGASQAYQGLDVNVLHKLILERLFGIDKENMANQKNLIYTRDPAEAIAMADKGEANCAFLMNPTRVGEIAAVAGAGEKMPQKSTYFYPKLITGMVMNRLNYN